MNKKDMYEKVIELARRRGFFWPSYEIYGGVGGFIDFGPTGTMLKRRIENKWRDFFLRKHGFLEIETPIMTPERVFEASGHIEHFKDPMAVCKLCSRRYRVDHLLSDSGAQHTEALDLDQLDKELRARGITCPECSGELSEPAYVQTMFRTTIGADSTGYGRPEAAQGIFVNFKRVHEIAREQFPIGVGQVGHALRNEISPRQGPLRLREFTIMEFEFFFDPEEPSCPMLKDVEDSELNMIPTHVRSTGSEESIQITVGEAVQKKIILMEWMAYFMALSQQFIIELGIPRDRQRFLEKLPAERAHYSAQTFDQEIYLDRWGWTEISGHAYRTSYDILRHMHYSGVDKRVFRQFSKPIEVEENRIMPNLEAIHRTFAEDSARVMEMVKSVDVKTIEESFLNEGVFIIDKFRITPDHLRVYTYKKKETGKRITPHVIEPSFGADRLVYAAMEYAYSLREDRVVLRLPRNLAPFQAVVLPLVSKADLIIEAKGIHRTLLDRRFEAYYDDVGSIGRRYARSDEIGVPMAITVDYETLVDETVTVRDRDTWEQTRVHRKELPDLIQGLLNT